MEEEFTPLTSEQLQQLFGEGYDVTVNNIVDDAKKSIAESEPPKVEETPLETETAQEPKDESANQETSSPTFEARIDHSAVALAVKPFENIKVIKVNGKLVIKDLEEGLSPIHKICRAIKNFFVDKKPKKKT